MKLNASAIKSRFFFLRQDSALNTDGNDFGILDHIGRILAISRKNGIDKCLVKARSHIDYVARKLGINPVQALFFSHILERSSDERTTIGEIARSVQCSNVMAFKYLSECDELEKKKLIYCARINDGISYRVPHNVRVSLRKYNEFRPEKKENLSIGKLFVNIKRLFDEKKDSELSFSALAAELMDLINLNMHLEFCKKIMSYNLEKVDLVLLICFCHLTANNHDSNIGYYDIEFLYEHEDEIELGLMDVEFDLKHGFHTLIEKEYVQFADGDGFIDSEHWKLSDKAKKELLAEYKNKEQYKKRLILFNTIQAKKMFFNTRETLEIEKLTSLLRETNFRKIQGRLGDKSMRKGFACLFSGSPGTGKTETVYQIARQTRRNIMLVDIAGIKSCWYGESEKKIKELFDLYRSAVEKSKIAPILLFNEADAVIGKRRINNGNNHSLDQTENTIQNIILQEIENLEGILIATTNLAQNMDNAFERRFLYKIKFEKPGRESRAGIWTSLLPDLPENWAAELSKRFELSGGQIENIARKTEVDRILSGEKLSMDTLIQYCKDETQNGFNASTRIGFTNE